MTIWSAEIKEIERLYDSIKGQSPELEKELERLISASDENMVLVYARRCLEVIVTDLCESELKRPRKTEPLQGIIDKLNREEKIPSHIFASMQSLNSLSTFGSHPKEFDPRQVKPVLNNLTTIIEWYLKYKNTQTISEAKAEEAKHNIEKQVDAKELSRKPRKSMVLLLSGLLLVVAIVAVSLFVFDIIGGGNQTKELEKSIAVLPFKLLSEEPDKQYLADGMMDAILLHLSRIEDLRVISRTSVEQYRESGKMIPEIGRELGVEYLLEGSFQKYGDNVKLIVQLLTTSKERHVWSNEYDRNWNDIFYVQSEVAQAIASELHAMITPLERQTIEKIPTTELTAYDFYQRGREEFIKYWIDNNNREALEKAEKFYHKALEFDHTFAQAYTGLAQVYWNKHYWEEFFSGNFQDSAIILCDIALSLDHQLSEAYTLKGTYYSEIGKSEQAIEDFDKAIQYNPNDWMAYYGRGILYSTVDLVKAIDNFHKSASLNRGEQLPELLRSSIGWEYMLAGFPEKAYYYWQEALNLDGDSSKYYIYVAMNEFYRGNFEKSIEYADKAYLIDSTDTYPFFNIGSALNHIFLGNYEKSLKYINKYLEYLKSSEQTDISNVWIIGYIYWKNGHIEKAEYFFNETIKNSNRMIDLGRAYAQAPEVYYDLAGIYAFRGETDKAFKNLRIFSQKPCVEIKWGTLLKNDPLFDSIRGEPEFQQIIRDIEAKYQAEHERVRKWLEEQGSK